MGTGTGGNGGQTGSGTGGSSGQTGGGTGGIGGQTGGGTGCSVTRTGGNAGQTGGSNGQGKYHTHRLMLSSSQNMTVLDKASTEPSKVSDLY